MDTATPTTRFEDTPLITPERVQANSRAALAVHPAWVRHIHIELATSEQEHPSVQPVVFIWAGRSRIQYEAHTALATAILWEITRLPGVSIAVNSNGSRSRYFRFSIPDAGEDLTTVSRFLTNAGPDEQVMKTPSRKWDMRTETLRKASAGKPSKNSRDVLMGHIERIAKNWEASGRMPPHITAADYLANLQRLLQLSDLEATGKELSDLLATQTEA